MKLLITTLSPVHIGSGDKYTGLSHLSEGNTVYVYEAEQIARNLGDYGARFASWIEERVAEIGRLDKEFQAIDRRNRQRWEQKRDEKRRAERKLSLKQFLSDIKDKSVEQRFKQSGHFMHCLSIPQGITIYPATEIEQLMRVNGQPYIPGTEIKGAMRTAILYYLLKHNSSLYDSLYKDLLDFKKEHAAVINAVIRFVAEKKYNQARERKKRLVKAMAKLEERLQYRVLFAGSHTEAQYDLFRFVAVADSKPVQAEASCFVTNVQVVGMSRNVYITQELLRTGTTFDSEGFNVGSPQSGAISTASVLGFATDQRAVLRDYRALLACCKEFSYRLLDEEIGYFSGSYPTVVTKLQEIKRQNTAESPVLRLGKGIGFLSLTVGLLLKDEDRALYDKDRALYDNVVSHATKNISYTGNFPKTRRMVDLGNGGYDTLGWVKLSVVESATGSEKSDTLLSSQMSSPPSQQDESASQEPRGKADIHALAKNWEKRKLK